jgi:hypothetical protein
VIKIKNANDTLSSVVKETIKDRLNKLFTKNSKQQHYKKNRTGIHASALIIPEGSWCPREQIIKYFKGKDEYKYLPPRVLRRMENGNSVHRKWQTLFINTKVAKRIEHQLLSNEIVTGTPDAIIELGRKRYVVEIKSTNDKSYSAMTKLPVGTKRQLMYYMYLVGVPNGIAIYENTNNSEFEIYLVEYDQEFIDKYIKREYEVKDGIKKYFNEEVLPKMHKRCTHKKAGRANSCNCTELCFNFSNYVDSSNKINQSKLEELIDANFRN